MKDVWNAVRQTLADQFDFAASEDDATVFVARLALNGFIIIPTPAIPGTKKARAVMLADAEQVLRLDARKPE